MRLPHLSSRLRFALQAMKSPTYCNLNMYLKKRNWRKTSFQCRAHFSEKNFQFDALAAQQLEFKDLLANLVAQYCPEVMPLTWCVHDGNWSEVLQHLVAAFYCTHGYVEDIREGVVWILKPALLNNGQHIKIFQSASQIEQHFLSSQRLGGKHVLQRYLTSPHLLQGPTAGHKYSLRLFVVLTNYAGAYLYPKGYFNVALQPYNRFDFINKSPHLTNEHLQEDALNVIQIPSTQIQFFPAFYGQIQSIVTKVVSGLQQLHPAAFYNPKEPRLAIFGFDFMVDAQEKVWLLEANHGPCFPTMADHPLFTPLYDDFWQAFIVNFVYPIATRQAVAVEGFDRVSP